MGKSPELEKSADQRYAGEAIRITEILTKYLGDERKAAEWAFRFQELARDIDEQVKKILTHPNVIRRYDIENYDGTVLEGREGILSIHALRDGLHVLSNLDEEQLQQRFRYIGSSPPAKEESLESLYDWLKKNTFDINEIRLQNLGKTGELHSYAPGKSSKKFLGEIDDLSDSQPKDHPEKDQMN